MPTGCPISTVANCPPLRRRGQNKARWLSAAEADGLRANWLPPWHINTEHFEIQTNVTLAEAISFGRRLEAFHDFFMALLADILGENYPAGAAIQRPVDDRRAGIQTALVYYFGSKRRIRRTPQPTPGAEDRDRALDFTIRPNQAGTAACRPIFFGTPTASCR